MAQERLFMWPHMNGINYHCLLEKVLIIQLLNKLKIRLEKTHIFQVIIYNNSKLQIHQINCRIKEINFHKKLSFTMINN